jgi:hypothetical protein
LKKQDVYAKITKMNAQLALEEETKRRKEMRTHQQMYREQLAEQLKEKKTIRNKENAESNMWFQMEMNQCQRQDEIENLNNMAKKGMVLSEKQNRERMIAQRERMRQEEEEKEKEADKQILANAERNIRIEHEKLMEQRAQEKEKYQKMLDDNKKRLALRQKQEEYAQVEDKKLIRQMMENEEKLQRQREEEFNKRLEKIQSKMSKMADTVVKNAREKELKDKGDCWHCKPKKKDKKFKMKKTVKPDNSTKTE